MRGATGQLVSSSRSLSPPQKPVYRFTTRLLGSRSLAPPHPYLVSAHNPHRSNKPMPETYAAGFSNPPKGVHLHLFGCLLHMLLHVCQDKGVAIPLLVPGPRIRHPGSCDQKRPEASRYPTARCTRANTKPTCVVEQYVFRLVSARIPAVGSTKQWFYHHSACQEHMQHTIYVLSCLN